MLQLVNLTGKRTAKEIKEEFVIVSPVEGEIKLLPKVAQKLGISDGDNVSIVGARDENGEIAAVYIGKGKNGTPVLDENGEQVYDKRNRQVFVENSSFGSIARATTTGSTTLKITVTAGWHDLGGDTNLNKFFELGEGVEAAVPTTSKEYPEHVSTYYPLSFVKSAEKAGYSDDEDDEKENVNAEVDNDDYEETEEI